MNPADFTFAKMAAPEMRAAIAHLCKTNFLVFQKVELGMRLGPQHKKWADRLATGMDVCEMAPRDHGKSMSLARAYVLWRLKYSDWVKEILILGADQDSAVQNLDKIKELLELRPGLRHLVPTTKKDSFYSRTEIKLTNDKTVKTRGMGSPLRGRHPQLIVLDDVLNEKNSLTPEDRDGTRRHFNEVVVPMKDKGFGLPGQTSQIVVIGTAQDRDDLYHELQRVGYLGEKLSAILDDEKRMALWPDRYSYADLMAIKARIGTLSFSKEYLNQPISDETSLFPPSLFEPLKDHTLSYQENYGGGQLPVYMGVDFSVPGSMDGDWTVVFLFTMDPNSKAFTPLNYWRARPSSLQEQLHKIELWCQLYNVSMGYLENNMFQQIYTNMVRSKSSLPLSGNTVTHSNKTSLEYGILSFRPMFENGKWRFPYKTEADRQKTDLIITEFNGVVQRKGRIGNESYHDDIVMAMWHGLCAARQGSSFKVDWGS
jgi:hypothetical protein